MLVAIAFLCGAFLWRVVRRGGGSLKNVAATWTLPVLVAAFWASTFPGPRCRSWGENLPAVSCEGGERPYWPMLALGTQAATLVFYAFLRLAPAIRRHRWLAVPTALVLGAASVPVYALMREGVRLRILW